MSNSDKIYLVYLRGALAVRVRVLSVSKVPQNGEWALIVPVSGEGSAWVDARELREVT